MTRKAIIFGIKGFNLSKDEKLLFKKFKPWGIILFSRNIKDLKQLKQLILSIKKIFNDKNFPILIDEEGGKVSRLNKIIDFSLFSQSYFSKLYDLNKRLFFPIYETYIDRVSELLKSVGININTVPVLDVRRKVTHKVIGDRSFSNNPHIVSKIGKLCINSYKKNKILNVVKHIPGHGLARSDSHFKLPIVIASKKELLKNDFIPFKKNTYFLAMTAHVVFSSYDSENPATHSKIVIREIIRKHINFKGILISDDICMKSLQLGLKENAIKSLNAGCNLVLHCSGKINEMKKLAKVIPNIDKFTQKKTSQLYKFLG